MHSASTCNFWSSTSLGRYYTFSILNTERSFGVLVRPLLLTSKLAYTQMFHICSLWWPNTQCTSCTHLYQKVPEQSSTSTVKSWVLYWWQRMHCIHQMWHLSPHGHSPVAKSGWQLFTESCSNRKPQMEIPNLQKSQFVVIYSPEGLPEMTASWQ